MDDFISVIIRIIVIGVIIRGFFKKANKATKTQAPSKLSEVQLKEKAERKARLKQALQSEIEKKLKASFGGAEEESLAKAFAEHAKVKKEMSITPKEHTVDNLNYSPRDEVKVKSSYQRVQTKSKKTTSKKKKKDNKIIEKNTFKKDVVKGVIFKEILSEPRAKQPYKIRK
jgi:hypothetical protein